MIVYVCDECGEIYILQERILNLNQLYCKVCGGKLYWLPSLKLH